MQKIVIKLWFFWEKIVIWYFLPHHPPQGDISNITLHHYKLSHKTRQKETYRMLSTLRGLMKTAMGWRPAIWRRFMAFPDTSSMQCLPWHTHTHTQRPHGCLGSFSSWVRRFAALSTLRSPCRRLPWRTVCWFHTGGCCIVQPRWTCAPGSLAPWALWRTWSGNLCRPPRSLAAAASCLRITFHILVNALFFLFVLLACLLFYDSNII